MPCSACHHTIHAGEGCCRLITRGAIEEKVYHRQIYKHALSTRILNDPRQKRYVASRDLRDLFSLSDRQHGTGSETGKIFRAVSKQVTATDVGRARPSGDGLGSVASPGDHGEVAAKGEEQGGRPGVGKVDDGTVHGDGREALQQSRLVDNEADSSCDGDDSTILRDLFGATGLHSALNHTAIEHSSDPARLDIEQHASKVAERAAAALRASREAVRLHPVHLCDPLLSRCHLFLLLSDMPTWPGVDTRQPCAEFSQNAFVSSGSHIRVWWAVPAMVLSVPPRRRALEPGSLVT
jgi:hypothetical protein